MKIRSADFAIIPTWVILHDAVRATPARIAVYAAIRVLKFEFPNRQWASERDLADDLASIAGVGAEAIRKHLRVLRQAEIVKGGSGEIFLPSDDPRGDTGPQIGDVGTQIGDVRPHTPITKKEEERLLSDESDECASKRAQMEQDFVFFYGQYPRREGRGQALKAYRAARGKVDNATIDSGLVRAKEHWKRERTEKRHIPLPATWLNGERWLDELDPGKKPGPNLVFMNGAWTAKSW